MKNYIGLALLFGSTLLSGMELDQIALDKELLRAAELGLKEECEILVEKGADVNAVMDLGYTVLSIAAEQGHKEVCKVLIANGADVNAADKCGITSLMVAANRSKKEACEILIANGADVNAINDLGNTALIIAAQNHCKEICEILMANGADMNIVNKKRGQFTALMEAAKYGHQEICELLLIHTLLRSNLRITLKEAKDRLFTTLLVLEQERAWGTLPRDIKLVILSLLREDLVTLVAGHHGNMDKFPPDLQEAVRWPPKTGELIKPG